MNGFTVKTHDELPVAKQQDIHDQATRIMSDADQGIQTAIVAADGKVRSIVGLNGVRYLPDPDPDPLDELLLMEPRRQAVRGIEVSDDLLRWLQARRDNCYRIALQKEGTDRDGWLEDAVYFTSAVMVVQAYLETASLLERPTAEAKTEG
jgi:hypothetical protein